MECDQSNRYIVLRHKTDAAALSVLLKAMAFQLWLKANFDPNQPRLPRGHPHGGRWKRPDGTSEIPPVEEVPYDLFDISTPVRVWDDTPPDLPERRPRGRELTKVLIREATWLLRQGLRAIPYVRYAEYALWLKEQAPLVRSYLDEPRPLSDLRARARLKIDGYDRHHIVEQDAARADGYPRSRIDAPDNLVLVPRIRHYLINGWFGRPNEDFGGLSPRDFLRGRSWEERHRIGVLALRLHGVME